MKKLVVMTIFASAFATVGCNTMSGEKEYAADTPPPLSTSRGERGSAAAAVDPVALPSLNSRVKAENVDETNLEDSIRRLEGEMTAEGRATAKLRR